MAKYGIGVKFTAGDHLTIENDGLLYVLHQGFMANELIAGYGAFEISQAEKGSSGLSFGPIQYDLAASNKGRAIFERIASSSLDSNNNRIINDNDLEKIQNHLYKPTRSMTDDDKKALQELLPKMNEALSSTTGQGIINEDYPIALEAKIERVKEVVDRITNLKNKEFIENDVGFQAAIGDHLNQYGDSTFDNGKQLMALLNQTKTDGAVSRGYTVKGDVISTNDLRDFKLTFGFAKEGDNATLVTNRHNSVIALARGVKRNISSYSSYEADPISTFESQITSKYSELMKLHADVEHSVDNQEKIEQLGKEIAQLELEKNIAIQEKIEEIKDNADTIEKQSLSAENKALEIINGDIKTAYLEPLKELSTQVSQFDADSGKIAYLEFVEQIRTNEITIQTAETIAFADNTHDKGLLNKESEVEVKAVQGFLHAQGYYGDAQADQVITGQWRETDTTAVRALQIANQNIMSVDGGVGQQFRNYMHASNLAELSKEDILSFIKEREDYVINHPDEIIAKNTAIMAENSQKITEIEQTAHTSIAELEARKGSVYERAFESANKEIAEINVNINDIHNKAKSLNDITQKVNVLGNDEALSPELKKELATVGIQFKSPAMEALDRADAYAKLNGNSSAEEIKAAQKYLFDKGAFPEGTTEKSAVDGKFGNGTKTAINAYPIKVLQQHLYDQDPKNFLGKTEKQATDGQLGPKTIEAIKTYQTNYQKSQIAAGVPENELIKITGKVDENLKLVIQNEYLASLTKSGIQSQLAEVKMAYDHDSEIYKDQRDQKIQMQESLVSAQQTLLSYQKDDGAIKVAAALYIKINDPLLDQSKSPYQHIKDDLAKNNISILSADEKNLFSKESIDLSNKDDAKAVQTLLIQAKNLDSTWTDANGKAHPSNDGDFGGRSIVALQKVLDDDAAKFIDVKEDGKLALKTDIEGGQLRANLESKLLPQSNLAIRLDNHRNELEKQQLTVSPIIKAGEDRLPQMVVSTVNETIELVEKSPETAQIEGHSFKDLMQRLLSGNLAADSDEFWSTVKGVADTPEAQAIDQAFFQKGLELESQQQLAAQIKEAEQPSIDMPSARKMGF